MSISIKDDDSAIVGTIYNNIVGISEVDGMRVEALIEVVQLRNGRHFREHGCLN